MWFGSKIFHPNDLPTVAECQRCGAVQNPAEPKNPVSISRRFDISSPLMITTISQQTLFISATGLGKADLAVSSKHS
jgi:hypothetical protein